MLDLPGAGALHPAPDVIDGTLGGTMSAPTVDPAHRALGDITNPDQYPRGAKVWVFRSGSWRPGIVLSSSPKAVIVRYRPTDSRGTGVDTVMADNLARRDDVDPYVDHLAGRVDSDGLTHRR
jgi:hypothetical protein